MGKISIENGLKKFSKTYFNEPISIDIKKFEKELKNYITEIKNAKEQEENEEFFKKIINDFLSNSFNYSNEYKINTKSKIDSAIYSNYNNSKKVHVITEVKTPMNVSEMVSTKKINAKALQEVILYYLKETRLITGKKVELNFDSEVKHLIITNSFEWFIIDANDIEKIVKGNIENFYYKYFNGLKESSNNPEFYKYLEKELKKIDVNNFLTYIYFNIEKYAKKENLVNIYKIFSQDFLIKKKYETKTSEHTLNKKFYHELLYILGFIEKKNKEKKIYEILINHDIKNSFADQVYHISTEEKEYNDEKAIELTMQIVITWMNRLLFIKLFEGQLLLINGEDNKYHILDKEKIANFETLYKLFFEVLGKKERNENDSIIEKFNNIPYLNSSLFELDKVETTEGINIKRIENKLIKIKTDSIIKEINKGQETYLLDYLLNFLNSYNFGAEIDENNIIKKGKDIIDASVLGLIFEKINGYKDGSYYTQSAITDYIAKETINRAVIKKINEVKKWNCLSIDDIIDKFNRSIGEAKEINEIINSIKICDIAVGSGHFLVSALNQLLYIKAQLGILLSIDKKDYIKGIKIDIDDGTLIIKDENDEKIYYKRKDVKSQKIQEMLFDEKRTILENCIFGVDINPNAVNICRLRLWIELLKSAYYKNNKMETLPNIDINIKTGNSLVNKVKFSIGEKISKDNNGADFSKGLKEYKKIIVNYKTSSDKILKNEIKKKIEEIKSGIVSSCIYDASKFTVIDNKLTIVHSSEETIYKNSFEWAFEFPEILDENGVFKGFDVIIGNPPYIDSERMSKCMSKEREYYVDKYNVAKGNWDIFVLFIERALSLIRKDGYLSFIVPNKLLYMPYAIEVRKLMMDRNITFIRDYSSVDVFPDADVYTIVFCLKNNKSKEQVLVEAMKDLMTIQKQKKVSAKEFYDNDNWGKYINTTNASLDIIEKLDTLPKLSKYTTINDPATTGEAYIIKEKLIDKNDDSNKYIKLINTGTIDAYKNFWGFENIVYLKTKYLNPVISTNDLKEISIKRYNESKNEKIILPGLVKRMEAYYDAGGFLAGKSTKIIQKKEVCDLDLKYITGLLNSKLLNFYLISMYGTSGMSGGYISLKKEMLYNLPIQNKIDKKLYNKTISLVLDIQEKYEKSKNTTSVIENKIKELDEIIYEIYNISDNERKSIEKYYN